MSYQYIYRHLCEHHLFVSGQLECNTKLRNFPVVNSSKQQFDSSRLNLPHGSRKCNKFVSFSVRFSNE